MPHTLSTRSEVDAEISDAIEAAGTEVARAAEYDLDAIARECYEYRSQPGKAQAAGFVQTSTTEEFWASVQRNEKAPV